MQLATWMKQQTPSLSAHDVANLYNKRFKLKISRQLMLQYSKGHPMPGPAVQKNIAALTGDKVSDADWHKLGRSLGKVKLGNGRWRRPSGTLKAAERAKPKQPYQRTHKLAAKPKRSGAVL